MKKTDLLRKIEIIRNTIKHQIYSNGHNSYEFEVTVKRYNDYIDIEKLINMTSRFKHYKKQILEDFTDNYITGIYDNWLEYERDYLVDDWLNGCCHTKEKWWRENVQSKIEREEITGYSHLDKIKTKENKLKKLEKWIKNDKRFLMAFNLIEEKGFAGRMGGHFVFNLKSPIIPQLDDLESEIENSNISIKEANYRFEEIKEDYDLAMMLCKEIGKMNKDMKFEDELIFRIDEKLDEYIAEERQEKEIAIAKKYAEKNGYHLAKII